MIEIQCTSCHTRYRVDERVLPEETPTFKCSRCGHVFSAEPRTRTSRVAVAGAVKAEPIAAAREEPPRAATTPDSRQPDAGEQAAPADQLRSAAEPDGQADELLDRSFAEHDQEPQSGENLTFDFIDEDLEHPNLGLSPGEQAASDRWEVGEAPGGSESERGMDGPSELAEDHYAELPEEPDRHEPDGEPDVGRRAFGEPGKRHSSGWFLMLFLMIGAIFGGLSQALVAWPSAGFGLLHQVPALGEHFVRSVAPSHEIALEEIGAGYQVLKEDPGHPTLVISGQARNVSRSPLHVVQVAVDLDDGNGNQVARQTVYCGNPISNKVIGQMTPRELNFFQRLEPPKAFVMAPGQSWPFQVVFVSPPPAAGKFHITVSEAQPAADSQAPGL